MKKFYAILLIAFFSIFNLYSQDCNSCSANNKCNGKNTPKSAAAKLAQSSEEEFEDYDPEKESQNTAGTTSSDDEFEDYNPDADTASVAVAQDAVISTPIYEHRLFFPISSLIMTALAGIFVRFSATRKLRGLFLAISVIVLGFYVGACPCPISSFSYTIIALSGGQVIWENMIWFLALIPLTYIFGKTWCGWVCHLGALQEFLFMPAGKLEFLKTRKAQQVMKYIRYVLVAILIVQLIITHSYLFNKIDPFKTAYNLGFNAGYTEWILLGLLVLTSVFMYRPFCKSACPIGLVLGWISKIPGASVLDKNESCAGCTLCATGCNQQAIYRDPVNKISVIDNKECIACGECLDNCKKCSMNFFRKNEKHKTVNKLCKENLPAE